jgi:hypothetical protein
MRTRVIYARSPQWADVAPRAEELMASAAFEPVKVEAKTTAGFVTIEDGTRAFIKRFDAGGAARALWAKIRGSRARRSLRGAALLQAHGFRCPEPYAALELGDRFSVRASYLISEPLAHAKTLSLFLNLRRRVRGPEAAWRRRMVAAVAGEIRKLHDVGLFSSDLQETNLMLEDTGGGAPKIYFVDLEGFRNAGRVRWPMRERNLVQLDRSIGRFLDRSARLRFLYAYLGGRPGRGEARAIVARLLGRKAREDRRRRGARERRRSAAPVELSSSN